MNTSFRDPAGQLMPLNGRILRLVNRVGSDDLRTFFESKSAKHLVESGSLVGTTFLGDTALPDFDFLRAFPSGLFQADAPVIVEHERIPFQNFPYENLHQDLTRENFESACRKVFTILRAHALGESGRWIYLLRNKRSSR